MYLKSKNSKVDVYLPLSSKNEGVQIVGVEHILYKLWWSKMNSGNKAVGIIVK